MSAYLSIESLCVSYGAISALSGVSFTIEAGRIVTLLGANGAGKTTTLRTLSGLLRAKSGRITFKGEDITRLPPHRIVAPNTRLAWASTGSASSSPARKASAT